MTASATWAAAFRDAAVEKGTKLGFKTGKGRIDELSARHHDDIERRSWLVLTEQLANATFGPVPHDRIPDFPGCGNAEPRRRGLGSLEEHHHVPAADLEAFRINQFEIRAAPNVLSRTESLAHACLDQNCKRLRFVRHGQPLPTLGAPALENVAAILRGHPDQETMCALAAPCVRLKRTLTLCHR